MMGKSVDEETKKKIKMRTHELCKEYCNINQYQIVERNKKIIRILMNEFNICNELAKECFLHNNEK